MKINLFCHKNNKTNEAQLVILACISGPHIVFDREFEFHGSKDILLTGPRLWTLLLCICHIRTWKLQFHGDLQLPALDHLFSLVATTIAHDDSMHHTTPSWRQHASYHCSSWRQHASYHYSSWRQHASYHYSSWRQHASYHCSSLRQHSSYHYSS